MMEDIDQIGRWVNEYFTGYTRYMEKYYPELLSKFYMNIQPPQKIGGCVGIMQGRIHSDEEFAEIMKISKEFCEKYEHPVNFPKDF